MRTTLIIRGNEKLIVREDYVDVAIDTVWRRHGRSLIMTVLLIWETFDAG